MDHETLKINSAHTIEEMIDPQSFMRKPTGRSTASTLRRDTDDSLGAVPNDTSRASRKNQSQKTDFSEQRQSVHSTEPGEEETFFPAKRSSSEKRRSLDENKRVSISTETPPTNKRVSISTEDTMKEEMGEEDL